MIIPNVQMAINKVDNLGFTAFFNMIKDGKLNVVTAIINDKIVPNCAPFESNASATGIKKSVKSTVGRYLWRRNNPKITHRFFVRVLQEK